MLCLLGIALPVTAQDGADAPPVRPGLQLFFDGQGVERLAGDARRMLHAPTPREVALEFDRPWEGPASAYVTALRTPEGTVRLYYRGLWDEKSEQYTCVAESTDGVHFTRPSLGQLEINGSTDNNTFLKGDDAHNLAPFVDTNPACDPSERYKALGGAPLYAYASADGLVWRRMQEGPVITDGAFDSQNTPSYDATRGCYVCYYRDFRNGVRTIRRMTSPDFLHWSGGEWLDFPGVPSEHLYTNAIVAYPRNPAILVGFPKRFVPERKKLADYAEPGVSDGVFMSSRDGLTWERWPEAFLRPGPDPENWTDRNNMVAWGLVPASATEIALYWSEHYQHPTSRIRRGTIRVDGFASVHAGVAGGELVTKPLEVTGPRLLVNYSTSAAGLMQFELLDEAGQPIPGFTLADSEQLFGDEIEHAVSWGASDLASLEGRTVSLHVHLADADLYSFVFAE
jgi:hypothetical protein